MIRLPFELDLETYRNYFLAKFFDEAAQQYYNVPMYEGCALDRELLINLLARCTAYTFNGNNYDVPILVLALYGASNYDLKQANDAIIKGGLKPWDFYRKYGIEIPQCMDHVDLMEVAPGVKISLKMYGGRIHAPRMQDLPIEPDADISAIERFQLSEYCGNDLQTTNLLRRGLKERLALRDAISAKYRIDVRSKSDAQIAEAVIKAKLDFKPEKRYIPHGYTFRYNPPAYLCYATPHMRELLDLVRSVEFVVSDKEEAQNLGIEESVKTGVQLPAVLAGRDVRMGAATYRMGIGGLHSQESSVSYYARDGWKIKDIDVKSYYPSMIIALDMYPSQLGPAFLRIYRDEIYLTRLQAKAEAERLFKIAEYLDGTDKEETLALATKLQTESDGLKIVLNGTFGKLFSKWSIFYAPEFGIATTVTGQLSLLMLIEMMELSNIRVISANTDGIVLHIPPGYEQIALDNVRWWEKQTGLEMEENDYSSIHLRDVNNYVAITTKGKVKRKGIFTPGGLLSGPGGKHPDKDICADAVIAYLKDGTPLDATIHKCDDIRKFIQVRQVTGGGSYVGINNQLTLEHPRYLGKAVRWYYGTNQGHIVNSKGHRVAGSENATPIMQLPNEMPDDVNHQHYIDVADEMLRNIGVDPKRNYWHHSGSDCWFSTDAKDLRDYYAMDGDCTPVSFDQYTKRKM